MNGKTSKNELGKVKYEQSKFEQFINTILCRGDLAKRKLDYKPVSIAGLLRFGNNHDYLMLFIGVICSIISGTTFSVLFLFVGDITNDLLLYSQNSTQFRDRAYTNVYVILGTGIFTLINNFIGYMCFYLLCIRIVSRIRHEFLKAILRQDAEWVERNHSGSLTTKLNDNVERIRDGIGDKLGLLIRGLAMVVSSIIISFFYQWRLALFMLGTIPPTCIIMSLMAKKTAAATTNELKSVSKAGEISEESLMGVRTVQAFNAQDYMTEKYSTELEKGKIHAILKGFWTGFLGSLFLLALLIFIGFGLLYGSYLLKVGIITKPGDVYTGVMTILMAAYYFGLISTHLMALLNARVSAAIIYGTIDRVPKIDPYSPEGKRPDSIEGRVEFRNVHFRYSTRSDAKVLDGINLVVEPGELTAIVGHSGSGKSTMVGLLTRLYEQEHGDVLLDNHDIRTLNIDWLRNNIGVVQQEPILFNDTIANNLKFGNPNASIEQMIEACRTANAHDFIVKTPKGYDTLIGDELSGGQKQRIVIARTLIRNPKVLLLDEATSALDANSESLVQAALNNAAKGRTTIVIAHRLSTIKEADKIVYIEKGKIAEMGTHDELIAMKGRYFDLVEAQLLKQEEDDEDSSSKDENFNLNDEFDIDATRFPDYNYSVKSRKTSEMSNSIKQKGSIRSNGTFGPRFSLAFDNEKHELREDDYKSSGGINEIFKNAQGNYHFLVIGLIFAILRGMELPGMALTFGYAFNALQSSNEGNIMTKMSHVTIIFISIGVAVVITQVISSVMFSIVSENLSIRFRVRSFHNILYQDAAFFDNPTHSPGKIITRLAVDAPNIKALVDNRALQIINGVSTLVAIIVIAFVYCWQVAIVGTAISGIIAVIMLTSIYYIKFMNIHEATSDEAGKVAIEVIENVKTIQLLTRTHEFYEKYENLIKQHKNKSLKLGIIEAINSTISQTSRYFIIPACYGLGIYLIYNEMRTPKEVFTCIYAFMVGTIAIMNCVSYYPEIVKARASAGVLFSMINRKPATGGCRDGMKIELNGNIQFDNIKFSYPLRPRNPVLRALNLSAQKGTTIALVGPSGCGKSTCISLLERFYDANAGILKIDGHDIKSLSLHHLRTQMAHVGQEPRLFSGTIKENVVFGLKNVSQEQIDKALEMANATSFLSKLPNNLDTEVGEKGSQLSGGQKQKIAIARALIRNPKILLLDEATSALDSESEKAVQEALDRALEGRTTIVIAHRLSSIQNVDLIVFIENGKVRESGTHLQLMSRKGRYYNLIQKQTLVM